MTDRRAVLVLGMHRSGTSALCGALNVVGVDFGSHLMPATDANEKGHWEHEEVVRLHNRLLSALESTWDDEQPLPSNWMEREITGEVRSLLLEVVERDFADKTIFGLKDPRFCRLIPLWLSLLEALRIEPQFVLILRHPWEVAQSLAKREGIEQGKSMLLWIDHLAQAERTTRAYRRAFVFYDELIMDPATALTALGKQLDIDLRPSEQIKGPLRKFVDSSLRHHRFTGTPEGELYSPISHAALEFYETMRQACLTDGLTERMDFLSKQFESKRELLCPRKTRTGKLSSEHVSNVALQVSLPPAEVSASSLFWLEARVSNRTTETLFSNSPHPVRLSYHWLDQTTRQMVIFEGQRTDLSPPLEPNSKGCYRMKIVTPGKPGKYLLQTTMLQEGVCWFEDIRPDIAQEFSVSVSAQAGPRAIEPPLRAGVTIGIPIYRGKLFLEESIASVQKQTYSEIEVILSLDGPDPERETIRRKFLTDTRFRLVIQPQRLGWMESWYDWDLGAMARQCESDWVFIIERDEELSPGWEQLNWREILTRTPFTHLWSPRRWVLPSNRFLRTDPWWPDLQLRFFKNNVQGTTFPTRLHDPIEVPGPGGCLRDLGIHHHVFWLCSRREREKRVRYYEHLRPGGGLGHYYLYEDYSPTVAALPEAPPNPIGAMEAMGVLGPGNAAKISLKLGTVPAYVGVSQLFWIDAIVVNQTNESLSAFPPFPVRLAYHWVDKHTGRVVVFDGNRSGLFPGVAPNTSGTYAMAVFAPNQPGEYLLQATLVQEGVGWLEKIEPAIAQEFTILVGANGRPQDYELPHRANAIRHDYQR